MPWWVARDPTRPPREPEARGPDSLLWLAVIARAVEDLLIALGSVDNSEKLDRRRLLHETTAWFQRPGSGVGSFEYVCLMANLPPALVRDRVAAILESPPERHRRDVDTSHLTVDQRETILALADDGLATKAIEAATGVTRRTIVRIRAAGDLVRTCQGCGQQFNPTAGKQRYCTTACRRRANPTPQQAPFRTMPTRLCEECGTEFTARTRIDQVYCTPVCARHANYRRQLRRTATCIVCGKQFVSRRGKYCSYPCQMRGMMVARRLCAAVAEVEEGEVTSEQQFWCGILAVAHSDLSRAAKMRPPYGSHPLTRYSPSQRDEIESWFFVDDSDPCGLTAICTLLNLDRERIRAMARQTIAGGHVLLHCRGILAVTDWTPSAPARRFGLLNP